MKVIVIGPSLSGKTTLIRQLQKRISEPISEIDNELTKMNGGSFPADPEYKHTVLAPKVVQKVLESDNIIFFTNTDYFTKEVTGTRYTGQYS